MQCIRHPSLSTAASVGLGMFILRLLPLPRDLGPIEQLWGGLGLCRRCRLELCMSTRDGGLGLQMQKAHVFRTCLVGSAWRDVMYSSREMTKKQELPAICCPEVGPAWLHAKPTKHHGGLRTWRVRL